MSTPEVDQQQLIRRIGRALLEAAPPNWKQMRAEYRSAGRHIEADVVVTSNEGQTFPIRPPMDVVELLGELRAAMYRPGRGTWLSGVYLLDHPSKFSAEFEPDTEPRWRRVPPPIGFQDELRRFPREDAHIPEWLRARAGLPPVPNPQAELGTPPGGMPIPGGPLAPHGPGAGQSNFGAGAPQRPGPPGFAPDAPPGPPPTPPGGAPRATPPAGPPGFTGTPPGGFPRPATRPNEPSGGFATPNPGTPPGAGNPRGGFDQPGTPGSQSAPAELDDFGSRPSAPAGGFAGGPARGEPRADAGAVESAGNQPAAPLGSPGGGPLVAPPGGKHAEPDSFAGNPFTPPGGQGGFAGGPPNTPPASSPRAEFTPNEFASDQPNPAQGGFAGGAPATPSVDNRHMTSDLDDFGGRSSAPPAGPGGFTAPDASGGFAAPAAGPGGSGGFVPPEAAPSNAPQAGARPFGQVDPESLANARDFMSNPPGTPVAPRRDPFGGTPLPDGGTHFRLSPDPEPGGVVGSTPPEGAAPPPPRPQ